MTCIDPIHERYPDGRCATCNRLRSRESRERARRGEARRRAERHYPTLPFAPLASIAPRALYGGHGTGEGDGGYAVMGGLKATLTPSQQRAYHRAQARGEIGVMQADTLAIALGYHPAEIWGRAWFAEDTA